MSKITDRVIGANMTLYKMKLKILSKSYRNLLHKQNELKMMHERFFEDYYELYELREFILANLNENIPDTIVDVAQSIKTAVEKWREEGVV